MATPTEADQTATLQQAIDKVQSTTRQGIVFIPSGTYRLTATIHVWAGIRLIGYGPTRPLFVLPANTPGFNGPTHHYLIEFNHQRPTDPLAPAPNGSPATFYSALSNIDIDLADGNPSAVAIRFHVAQHCYVAHVAVHAGSSFASIEDAGNLLADLELTGGRYGIYTQPTAPSWPFILMDSHLTGQSIAAIRSNDAAPTLIRLTIDHVPTALLVDFNHTDRIVLMHSTLAHITGPAISLDNASSTRNGLVFRDLRCNDVPTLLTIPGRAPTLARGPAYLLDDLTYGLELNLNGTEAGITLHANLHAVDQLPPPPVSDIPTLPETSAWINLRFFGAKGDAHTDDTVAIQRALDTHQPIYIPTGHYRITQPLKLPINAILVGLNPTTAVIELRDKTPAFAASPSDSSPVAMLTTATNDAAILTGFGIATQSINPRATALLWNSGTNSLLDDVRLLGGHGAVPAGAQPLSTANGHYGSTDPNPSWSTQHPSLIVHGGGTIRDIWTPSTFASAGLLIQHTSTPGRVYLLSAEHHVHDEILLDDAHHWTFFALQTEEERVESANAIALRIQSSSDLAFYNLAIYRVSRVINPSDHAIEIDDSTNIAFHSVRSYSGSQFAFDSTMNVSGVSIRPRFFNTWILGSTQPSAQRPSALLHQELTGFINLSSLSAAPDNSLYFLDLNRHNLYHWDRTTRPKVVPTGSLQPSAIEASGSIPLLANYYTTKTSLAELSHPDIEFPLLPANSNPLLIPTAITSDFYSLRDFASIASSFHQPDGPQLLNESTSNLLRGSSGLIRAPLGTPFLMASSATAITERAMIQPHAGKFSVTLSLFLPRGGDALTTDPVSGNIYLADGDLYVYTADGKLLHQVHTAERPVSLALAAGRLYLASRTTIYSIPLLKLAATSIH